MSSVVVVIRNLTTGAGVTGLTLTLRVSPFSSDAYTATPVSGKDGCYEFTGVASGTYKLFSSGAEDISFGGTNGRDITPDSDIVHKTGAETIAGIKTFSDVTIVADATADTHALNRQTADARYCNLSGNQTIGGVKTFSSSPEVPNAASGSDALNMTTGDARYGIACGTSNNILMVDSQIAADIAGIKYNTIQEAINYAQSQTPSATSRWTVFIVPHKNKTTGYNENITLQAYVDLSGLGLAKITGTISGGNANTTLYNLFCMYDGNYSISSVKAFNSYFQAYQSTPNGGYTLTVTACTLISCGLLSYAGTGPAVISGGTNVFVGGCWSNCDLQLASTDKGSVLSIQSPTVYVNF